jgi:hypothetical protein
MANELTAVVLRAKGRAPLLEPSSAAMLVAYVGGAFSAYVDRGSTRDPVPEDVVRFTVLALDYDGTIARDAVLNPEVRRSIGQVRIRGITVVIATGRILNDLRRVAGNLRFVDAVVAENGAVVAFPETGQSVLLAPRAPQSLVDELRRQSIPLQVGECVIEPDANSGELSLTQFASSNCRR